MDKGTGGREGEGNRDTYFNNYYCLKIISIFIFINKYRGKGGGRRGELSLLIKIKRK